MALAGAALILKVEDERSPYQALILNLSEQYETPAANVTWRGPEKLLLQLNVQAGFHSTRR